MKFLVDQPLGGLAKRLRFCGFDSAVLRLSLTKPDSLPAFAPDTYILTRQEAFQKLPRTDLLVLTAVTPQAQLEEVRRLLKIPRRAFSPLSRCSRCNEVLRPLARDRVSGLVPEHVFHHFPEFYECPICRRIFWPGSHLTGITKKMLKNTESGKEGS
jgi:hypothetical protein